MTWRWGFLGASRIGRRALAPAVLAAEGHVLQAVAARDHQRARDFADAFAAPTAYGEYAALLTDPAVDIVYNALPNDLHLAWSLRALEAGKHVLCEKPLALTAAEVETLQRVAGRTGRVVMEAFCHVHHPQIARVQQCLADGGIGALVAMTASFGNTLLAPDDFRWTAAQGGGALYDLGCYCISAMRVFAAREPVRVTATQALRGDVDASLHGMLDFGDGLAASFFCSFVSAHTQHFSLIGTTGKLDLDWPYSTKGRTTHLDHGAHIEAFAPVDPYIRMVEHFARMAAGESGLPYGLAWSAAQARTLDALFVAARTGQSVSLAA